MANKKKQVLVKRKYANGDIDFIYPQVRPKDVKVSSEGTLEPYIEKMNTITEGSTKVEKSNTNGNLKINGKENTVYSHPENGTTGTTYDSVITDKYGHVSSGVKSIKSNTSYYVSPTGSDTTGDGTTTKPFKTISYTLSNVSKNLNGLTVNIILKEGNYNERLYITGYNSGMLVISSESKNVIIDSITSDAHIVSNNSAQIIIKGVELRGSGDNTTTKPVIYITCSQFINVDDCIINGMNVKKTRDGSYIVGSNVRYSSVIFNNCQTCVVITQASGSYTTPSTVSVSKCTGENNVSVFISRKGTIYLEDNYRPQASVSDVIAEGGLIVKSSGGIIGSLQNDYIVYVSPIGSDITGDGTVLTPFKTISRAIDTVPKDLGGYTVTIKLADGTYNEALNIITFNSGGIIISGNTSDRSKVVILNQSNNRHTIRSYSANVLITGVTFKNGPDPINKQVVLYISSTKFVQISTCTIDGVNTTSTNAFNGIHIRSSNVRIVDTIFNNCKTCISDIIDGDRVTSNIQINTCTGINNNKVFDCIYSIIQLGDSYRPLSVEPDNISKGSLMIMSSGAVIGSLQANKTTYVATTGNDSTGDGSSTKPYKTIQRAIDTVPRDLGGYSTTIMIADGTYSERIVIKAFHSGQIVLLANSTNVIIDSPIAGPHYIANCSAQIKFESGTYKGSGTNTDNQPVIQLLNTQYIHFKNNILDGTNTAAKRCGVYLQGTSVRFLSVIFNNCRECIYSMKNETTDIVPSLVGLRGCTGSNNTRVFTCRNTTIHLEDKSLPVTSSPDIIEEGGLIVKSYGAVIGSARFEVTLTSAGWSGTSAPYTQTVNITGATEDMEVMVMKALADGATPATQEAYKLAFSIIVDGTGTMNNGSATFKVYKKPATDIKIILKGV